ncbi:hypothetical protein [Pedobacter gandavensis]|uniref:DUF4835 family protein n=1 Tax=Pedobacter gandavensis TaxID=2679963 RepID=A0ABR6EV30_9SPHI|nr:hypothetical protein [Pedobacter gandavensis]MBB2149123.1 hypothetical protein [Pedobacter gandavensis]
MKSILKSIFFILLITLVTEARAQFQVNVSVDTVHNPVNKQIIAVLEDYFKVARKDSLAQKFWIEDEVRMLKTFDLLKDIYSYTRSKDCIILGIAKEKEDVFRIKLMHESIGTDGKKTVYFICSYIFYKNGDSYRIGNALFWQLKADQYQQLASKNIIYHFPRNSQLPAQNIKLANRLLDNLQTFLGKKLDKKIDFYSAEDCVNLYRLRGFDYYPGTMSSVTKHGCGYTDARNYLMYGNNSGYQKHELLRSVLILCPDGAAVLKDGLVNLCGGSIGKPTAYHIKKLLPYLRNNPGVFKNIDDFYFFDEETVPSFVFNAVLVHYILKKDGPEKLKSLLKDPTLKYATLPELLEQLYQIKDLSGFFLTEMAKYEDGNKKLEFETLLD